MHKELSLVEERNNFRKFLLCHLLVLLLILSFLTPPFSAFWNFLDVGFFKLLNGSLEGRKSWQLFWALLNHSYMDWVGDAMMVGYFLYFIFKGKRGSRQSRAAAFVFCGLYIAAIAFFVNRIFFRKYLTFHRDSPSYVVDSCVRLSREFDWLSIKDGSSKSFPGDHATTAISFFLCFRYFAGWKPGLAALGYTLLVSLPRLVLGAHWLSDVVIGSIPIATLCFAWIFYTPVQKWGVRMLTKCFSWPSRLKSAI